MNKKRPASITVFAILNLVFGGLGLLCSVCGVGGLALGPALQNMQPQAGPNGGFDPQGLQKHMEAKVPGYVALQWGQVGLGMVLSLVLVFGGIGLLRMNPSARWICIGYSVVTILYHLGYMVYTIAIVNPAIDEWMKQQGIQLPTGIFAAGSVIGALIGMTYAVILFIFMMLPSTGTALTSDSVSDFGGSSDDYYDPDFERRRRDVPPES